jgi:hypothetical protein
VPGSNQHTFIVQHTKVRIRQRGASRGGIQGGHSVALSWTESHRNIELRRRDDMRGEWLLRCARGRKPGLNPICHSQDTRGQSFRGKLKCGERLTTTCQNSACASGGGGGWATHAEFNGEHDARIGFTHRSTGFKSATKKILPPCRTPCPAGH